MISRAITVDYAIGDSVLLRLRDYAPLSDQNSESSRCCARWLTRTGSPTATRRVTWVTLLDDNNRKPTARLHLNRAQKSVGLFDENR